MKSNTEEIIICRWCGQATNIIWVHGHGQCAICGINIEECCRGEQCEVLQEEALLKHVMEKE